VSDEDLIPLTARDWSELRRLLLLLGLFWANLWLWLRVWLG
jgi:hypothetical protein